MKHIITRTILVLSLVSLFTDISSEMLYPVMPVFLQSIGFSTILIGVLEGLAEAVAGLSKMYFGRLSDETGRRMSFVRMGYLLSALSKPMLSFFTFTWWIFSARTIDRFGKGIRTGARDALLSDETIPENKATVFGFHRALDTTGAAIGPLAALVYLHFHPGNYATLFLIAFVPALLSVLLTFMIKEKQKKIASPINAGTFAEKFFYWKIAPVNFRQLMIGLLFFGLINSSDVFLLLRVKEITGSDANVLTAYIFYNLVFALFAFPIGRIADKFGMKRMIGIGLLLFAVVYTGMAFADSYLLVITLFFLYGIYAAATEGVAKALISNLVPRTETASAIGFYTGWNSICAFIASSLTGLVWYLISPEAAFLMSAAGSLLVMVYLNTRKW
ncbi:MAG TPA: MFS transporter [Chitinophagales bacterium]|nr:MFS transporter [Chitinophagales bacterium]